MNNTKDVKLADCKDLLRMIVHFAQKGERMRKNGCLCVASETDAQKEQMLEIFNRQEACKDLVISALENVHGKLTAAELTVAALLAILKAEGCGTYSREEIAQLEEFVSTILDSEKSTEQKKEGVTE